MMMRFERMGKYEFEDTARKRAAYARKLRLEMERYPLFADEIALGQTPVDVVMQGRALRYAEQMLRDRARQAEKWRQARQRLSTYPGPVKAALKRKWDTCGWPGNPTYLLSLMHMYDNGRLDLPGLEVHHG